MYTHSHAHLHTHMCPQATTVQLVTHCAVVELVVAMPGTYVEQGVDLIVNLGPPSPHTSIPSGPSSTPLS